MKIRNRSFGLLLAATIPLLTGVPALGQDGGAASRPAVSAESVDRLIEQLGADDYASRKEATQQLRALGETARADLEHAVEDHDDAEIKMRAQRILSKMDRKVGDGRRETLWKSGRRGPFGHGAEVHELRDMIEGLLDERMLSRDGLLERVFKDIGEVDRQWLRGRLLPKALLKVEPGEGSSFLWGHGTDVDGDSDSQSESVRVEINQEGVRVEVGDGETDAEVYEAPDMETFREQHPEIADRFFGGGRGGFQVRVGESPSILHWHDQGHAPVIVPPLGPGTLFERAPTAPEPTKALPRGQRLGVYVDALDPTIAEFLGFDAGSGLRINRVFDGTLADQLGLRIGDVLVEVAGRAISGRRDVAMALAGVEEGAEVEVVLNRRGRELELRADKPGPGTDESVEEVPEPPRESVLRKR